LEPIIVFDRVRKEYPFYKEMTEGIKAFLFNLPRNLKSFRKKKFVALQDVSFEVRKGETIGIIGRNGSGKSTLLGLIAGILLPNHGRVTVRGRVSSLLELGAGFHPDLSGYENIYLNGLLMGSSKKEIEERIDSIVAFSELGEFILQPLRTYSSGMYMRLAFASAIHIDPDILIVDEVLAVGDSKFQEKCFIKMKEFKEKGVTIVLVSHDMSVIEKIADRVIWIDGGKIVETGPPRKVVKMYLGGNGKEDNAAVQSAGTIEEERIEETRADSSDHIEWETRLFSWWENPIIIQHVEQCISGSKNKTFYDYLKERVDYPLERGLCIANQLEVMGRKMEEEKICRSVKALFAPPLDGEAILKKCRETGSKFDLLLTIDLLNRVDDGDKLLGGLRWMLKRGGFIVSIEQVPMRPGQVESEDGILKDLFEIITSRIIPEEERPTFDDTVQEVSRSGSGRNDIFAILKRHCSISEVKYFGSLIYEVVFNKILRYLDQERDRHLIESVLDLEDTLLSNNILKHNYMVVIGKVS